MRGHSVTLPTVGVARVICSTCEKTSSGARGPLPLVDDRRVAADGAPDVSPPGSGATLREATMTGQEVVPGEKRCGCTRYRAGEALVRLATRTQQSRCGALQAK